ncbi:IS66 family insertion sequence element accessory protein TnpB [Aromatoleum aromaticum]|uniref:IS66 family insertion sequence element accessory protein TnpB n=1 Tax=Aromatoleum aromaticum TaxID=551760 RepID=UPI00203DAFF9|nr:IS66 family insertion sequence element accessory protein TnpB [Aromatoleum aromaticum]
MIPPEQIWLAVEPIDMRLGIDGLSARLQNSLGRAPCDGSAYAFINRARTRLKVLLWDGTGVWLSQRRLHRGSFSWPAAIRRCSRCRPSSGSGSWRGCNGSA